MSTPLQVLPPDAASFRTVLGHYATGIAIITGSQRCTAAR